MAALIWCRIARAAVSALLVVVAGASGWACLGISVNPGSWTGDSNIRDTARVDGNDGVVVATIKTNLRGRILITDRYNSKLAAALLVEPGLNFKIIRLRLGTYRWSDLEFESATGSAQCRFSAHEEFEVIGNAINYVGDPEILVDGGSSTLDTDVCHLSIQDRGSETRSFLRASYPKLSAALGFSWSLTKGTSASLIPNSVLEDGEPRPRAPNPRAVIAKVLTDTAGFRDQLCACEDQRCADGVSRAMQRWTREFGLDSNSPKLTAEERAQLDETTRALRECRSAAVRPGTSGDPSPATAPAPPTPPR